MLHVKTFRTMCVQQLDRPNFVFAHNAGDPRQREFQFFRLWRGGKKKAALRISLPRWLCREMHFPDGRSRGIGFQIQLQELEKNSGIEHGNRQSERAGECRQS